MSASEPADRGTPDQQGGRVLARRYELQGRIDAGGAGEVWRARDLRLRREVAVKILGADADEAFRARFADEARRAAAVSHPKVGTVFDEGRQGGEAFMVMALIRWRRRGGVLGAPAPLHE